MYLKPMTIVVIAMASPMIGKAELNVSYYKNGLVTIRKNYEETNKKISGEILKLSSEANQKLLLEMQSCYVKEFQERVEHISNTIKEYEQSLQTEESKEMHDQILVKSRELISFSKLSINILADKVRAFDSADNEKIKNFIRSQ